MMMMSCFCGMVERWKTFSLISNQDYYQRSFQSQKPELGLTWLELGSSVYITTFPLIFERSFFNGNFKNNQNVLEALG